MNTSITRRGVAGDSDTGLTLAFPFTYYSIRSEGGRTYFRRDVPAETDLPLPVRICEYWSELLGHAE